jgi:hypothetical protein
MMSTLAEIWLQKLKQWRRLAREILRLKDLEVLLDFADSNHELSQDKQARKARISFSIEMQDALGSPYVADVSAFRRRVVYLVRCSRCCG